ncbi:hypothetical protein [Kitasatospora sp. NPDC088783]|uniref:hypothetical protein n=1 Tax=Kitasatospora sp. NPDC088783 TaxID=3364077 RepID=UPI00382EC97C
MFSPSREFSSLGQVVPPARRRTLEKVPFVQLSDARLQGVVSSGSDIARVYVSSIAARTFDFSCSTNNNRPCGGLRGNPCKHIDALLSEAVAQIGAERLAAYLKVDTGAATSVPTIGDIHRAMAAARPNKAAVSPAPAVFARFLEHLTYFDHPAVTEPLPDLAWFPAARAA